MRRNSSARSSVGCVLVVASRNMAQGATQSLIGDAVTSIVWTVDSIGSVTGGKMVKTTCSPLLVEAFPHARVVRTNTPNITIETFFDSIPILSIFDPSSKFKG